LARFQAECGEFVEFLGRESRNLRRLETMIQHVTRQIRPDQLDRCVQFYEILGYFPVAAPASVQGRAVWLRHADGGPDLHLMVDGEATVERGHVAFVISPYEAVVARLSEAGFEVEPRREHWGSPRAYVRDPAGNLVELMAEAPGGRRQ
jgi:catechol 2,3-dioxygenase-like lactoylglutathione lyase family enzyme